MEDVEKPFKIQCNSEVFEYVRRFCEYHMQNPKMVSKFTPDGPIDHFIPFDKALSLELREKPDVLFQLVDAADLLDQMKLLDLACRSCAMLLYGQNEEQIRKKFSLLYHRHNNTNATPVTVCKPTAFGHEQTFPR